MNKLDIISTNIRVDSLSWLYSLLLAVIYSNVNAKLLTKYLRRHPSKHILAKKLLQVPPRTIKHRLTCPFERTSDSLLIGRIGNLVIPRNRLEEVPELNSRPQDERVKWLPFRSLVSLWGSSSRVSQWDKHGIKLVHITYPSLDDDTTI